MNITGKVKLELTVAPDGHVKSARPLGGSPLLYRFSHQGGEGLEI